MFLQGAFAVPPLAVDALAALLRGGRIMLQLAPSDRGASRRPAAEQELTDVAAGGSEGGLAASDEAHVDVALTAHALSEEPEGGVLHQELTGKMLHGMQRML